jgi:hypothetical protein
MKLGRLGKICDPSKKRYPPPQIDMNISKNRIDVKKKNEEKNFFLILNEIALSI